MRKMTDEEHKTNNHYKDKLEKQRTEYDNYYDSLMTQMAELEVNIKNTKNEVYEGVDSNRKKGPHFVICLD